MSLTARFALLGALLLVAIIAVVWAALRALRREDMPPAGFEEPPVARRHARPEVASTPPTGFLAAPVLALPEVSHDEYAPPPMRPHGHAHMDGGVLTPVLAPALLAVAVLRAQAAACIVTSAQQAPFDRWLSDSFVGALPALTPERIAALDAEHAKAGEAA